jgi:hypothetical protein
MLDISKFKKEEDFMHPINGYLNNDFTWTILSGTQEFEINRDDFFKPKNEYDFLYADNPLETKSKYDKELTYKLNNHGFRCDDFNRQDSSSGFLVGGCSHTFGIGMPYDATWGYFVNEKLGGEKFFNVGISAGNIYTNSFNIHQFVSKYGKPKGIFLFLPNFGRTPHFEVSNTNISFQRTLLFYEPKEKNLQDLQKFLKLNEMRNLEIFCNMLDIPFIWSTWDFSIDDMLQRDNLQNTFFTNYVRFGDYMSYKGLDQKNARYPRYWKKARDKIHMAERDHLNVANMFETEYNKRYVQKNN